VSKVFGLESTQWLIARLDTFVRLSSFDFFFATPFGGLLC